MFDYSLQIFSSTEVGMEGQVPGPFRSEMRVFSATKEPGILLQSLTVENQTIQVSSVSRL